jgi:hypothetical protein
MRLALHIPNPRALAVEYTRVVIKSILGALALRLALGRSMDVLCVRSTAVDENKGGGDPSRPTTIEVIIVGGGPYHALCATRAALGRLKIPKTIGT